MVTWPSLRLFFVKAILGKWHTRQIDFVLAYPQADAECEIFVKIPTGYHLKDANPKTHCLRLVKNIYGTRQAGRTWNRHLHKGLTEMGFKRSQVDQCVYYRGDVMFLCYVDDCVIGSPNKSDVDKVISDLSQKFKVEDWGNVKDFLGVQINESANGEITLNQPHLIDNILKDLSFQNNTKGKGIPALMTRLLEEDEDGPPMNPDFPYQRVIGKLNFLEKSTRPDIAFAVHQCARFSQSPK